MRVAAYENAPRAPDGRRARASTKLGRARVPVPLVGAASCATRQHQADRRLADSSCSPRRPRGSLRQPRQPRSLAPHHDPDTELDAWADGASRGRAARRGDCQTPGYVLTGRRPRPGTLAGLGDVEGRTRAACRCRAIVAGDQGTDDGELESVYLGLWLLRHKGYVTGEAPAALAGRAVPGARRFFSGAFG